MKRILIKPLEIPTKGTAVELVVLVLNFVLFSQQISTYFTLKSEEGTILLDGNLTLGQREVSKWSDDDTVIAKLVAKAINVTIKSFVDVEQPSAPGATASNKRKSAKPQPDEESTE